MSGKRYDSGKIRFDLIPPEADFAIAAVGGFGAEKYGDRNWEKGMRYSRMLGSLKRHLNKWESGIHWDDESGMPHLYHVLWNVAALVAFDERGIGTQKDENGNYFNDLPISDNPFAVLERWSFTEETIKERSTQFHEAQAQEQAESGPNALMKEWEVPSEAVPAEQEAFDDAVSASSFHALGGASTCSAPSCVCCDDPNTQTEEGED
jgi:hypothetical protein